MEAEELLFEEGGELKLTLIYLKFDVFNKKNKQKQRKKLKQTPQHEITNTTTMNKIRLYILF